MATNHKWNVLNIMRFYNRIGKDFNTHVYMDFFGPSDEIEHGKVKMPKEPDINLIIRRYIRNGWAVRKSGNVFITDKGKLALIKYEKEQHLKNLRKRENRYEEHADYLKTVKRVHNPDGTFKKTKI